MTIIDLLPHMDAGDKKLKKLWQGDHDERPLVEFGWQQARAQAEALAEESSDALYSSPALRSRQTLEPLAESLGLEIVVIDGLGDNQTWHVPGSWDPDHERGVNIAPHAAGMAMSALWDIPLAYTEGHVVACSHGHVIPAIVSFLIAAHSLEGVPELKRRGQWYRLRVAEDEVSLDLQEAPPGFPA